MITAAVAGLRRGALPAGTGPVGIGVVVLGIAAYAYLALGRRALGDASYSALSVLWILLFTVGPGIFLPVEQELGRVVAHRRALGQRIGPLVAQAAGGAALLVALVAVPLVVAPAGIARLLFSGDQGAGWALLGGVGVLACAHLSRGVLAGHGLFGAYGIQLGADGLLRALFAVVLLSTGVDRAWVWGAVLAVAPAVAVVVSVLPHLRGIREHPVAAVEPAPGPSGFSAALGTLLVATLASQALANGIVVVAQVSRDPADVAVAGSLLTGLVVARVPLLLYASVQASLLPRLAAARAHQDRREFLGLLGRTSATVTALGLANLAGVVLLGPWVLRVFFGTTGGLGRLDLSLLAGGTAAFMSASVVGLGLLGLERHREQLTGWAAGVAGFAVAFGLLGGSGLVPRVTWSYLAGTAVALAAMAVLVLARTRHLRAGPAPRLPAPGGTA